MNSSDITVRLGRKKESVLERSPSPSSENGQEVRNSSLDSAASDFRPCTTALSSVPHQSSASASNLVSTQVRTLFVSGLPMDTKQRELYLLFRAYPGYESALLKVTMKNGKTASPVGFVTFTSKHAADEARKALQGVRFDPDSAQTIRLELARSNTKVSKPKRISPAPVLQNSAGLQATMLQNAAVVAASQSNQLFASLSTSHAHDFANASAACFEPTLSSILSDSQLLALSSLPQFTQHFIFPGNSTLQLPVANSNTAAAALLQSNASLFPANASLFPTNAALAQLTAAAQMNAVSQNAMNLSTPTCSTLFVANLAPNTSEDELKQMFRAFPGFSRLRLFSKGSSAIAFVEFADVRQAAQAMTGLQGFHIPSSDRGGIRIEFAKNKMSDVNGS